MPGKRNSAYRICLPAAGFALLMILLPGTASSSIRLKIATIAPQGTTWDVYLKNFARQVKRETRGAVDVQVFSGGVLGDEADYVNLLQAGEIDMAGVTVHGISLLAKEFLVMASPFQFKNYSEVDAALKQFHADFYRIFNEKGYIPYFLDHGFIHIYSSKDYSHLGSIRTARVWVWLDEPSAQLIFKAFNVRNFLPSSFNEVLQELKIDLIDIVYTSPLVCISAMWDQYVKYIFTPPIRYEPAVVLVKSDVVRKLGEKYWKVVSELMGVTLEQVKKSIRKEQEEALKTLEKKLKVLSIPPGLMGEVRERTLRDMIRQGIVPSDLIKKLNAFLLNYRKMGRH